METVTEGVEDAEALATLADNGCDLAQGWFVSRPMRADQVATYLARHAADGDGDHETYQEDDWDILAASGSKASST